MTATEIQSAILSGQFTDRELRDLNGTIVNILKSKRSAATRAAKSKLFPGMKVKWNGRKGFQTGTIIRVNRTRCEVDTGGYRNWTVPMTMLEAV
ncbi:MAG: hypothetical protein CBC29_06395 [Methylococcaceae bacterium TMED69]|nr:MAG: hypothetical protein CBC29_06395 [Methylococcaceae bacterium TMED69]|tara:strand:+ start:362 stop:643 length:282 start_codon:yes stop_codon:yes gene_type:complete